MWAEKPYLLHCVRCWPVPLLPAGLSWPCAQTADATENQKLIRRAERLQRAQRLAPTLGLGEVLAYTSRGWVPAVWSLIGWALARAARILITTFLNPFARFGASLRRSRLRLGKEFIQYIFTFLCRDILIVLCIVEGKREMRNRLNPSFV